jgi:hypothetical protein
MKKFVPLLTVWALLFLINWSANAQKLKASQFTRIEGYQPRAASFPNKELITQMFARKDQFDAVFETKKGSKASTIDFKTNSIIACFGDKSILAGNLSLDKIQKKEGVLEVYFKAEMGKKNSTATAPCCLYSIKTDKNLYGVDFFINGKLTQELRN